MTTTLFTLSLVGWLLALAGWFLIVPDMMEPAPTRWTFAKAWFFIAGMTYHACVMLDCLMKGITT